MHWGVGQVDGGRALLGPSSKHSHLLGVHRTCWGTLYLSNAKHSHLLKELFLGVTVVKLQAIVKLLGSLTQSGVAYIVLAMSTLLLFFTAIACLSASAIVHQTVGLLDDAAIAVFVWRYEQI